MIMHANHDCQFLFIKNHVLVIIYYVMKYIFKFEITLHSKFTIAVAVCKALSIIFSFFTTDRRRKMILKTYNKLNSHREINISETISHFLRFSDHYIDKNFQYIHIIHLLHYF